MISEYKEMLHLWYQATEDDKVVSDVTVEIDQPEGLTIQKVHRFIKGALHTIGFSSENIEEVFGPDTYSDYE